jgi:hypothetical protein
MDAQLEVADNFEVGDAKGRCGAGETLYKYLHRMARELLRSRCLVWGDLNLDTGCSVQSDDLSLDRTTATYGRRHELANGTVTVSDSIEPSLSWNDDVVLQRACG